MHTDAILRTAVVRRSVGENVRCNLRHHSRNSKNMTGAETLLDHV